MKKRILLFLLFIKLTGCSHFNALLEDNKETEKAKTVQVLKYSDTAQMPITSDRQYKRMNRQRMEEESQLGSQAGSMWVMDGQGSYLFSQNKARQPGDLLNVKLDGAGLKQVETKVKVIKQLLKQLEEQRRQQELKNNPALAENQNSNREPAAASPPSANAASPESAKPADPEEVDSLADMESIPTRITEKLSDGNYRIKGDQPFMIGKREYKVIVTGIIRPEDFNDEGVNSKKLLDPQFDVVSLRKRGDIQ